MCIRDSYIPWLTLYAHTERLGDDNDDILHMPASTLREAYCLRPEQSLVRRLAAKAELLSQLVQEPSSDIEMAVETPTDRKLGYYETMRYLQTVSYTHLDVYKRQGLNLER